ncbi:MAG: hypothetical protein RIE77_08320 [Phycisphaerales bacterium]|jgi:hypothetical protein
MHVCTNHACHASHAHAGFCTDCLAFHAGVFSVSVPTVLAIALGVGLLAYAGRRLLSMRETRVAVA